MTAGRLSDIGWHREFEGPINLSDSRELVTLRDAANYITKLPKAEHDAEEWQAAMEALLIVAERSGRTMFARIGVMRAVNRHVVLNAFSIQHITGDGGGRNIVRYACQ